MKKRKCKSRCKRAYELALQSRDELEQLRIEHGLLRDAHLCVYEQLMANERAIVNMLIALGVEDNRKKTGAADDGS